MVERRIATLLEKQCKSQGLAHDPMFVDVKTEEKNNSVWRLARMYGEFRWENKHLTRNRMRQLHRSIDLPWILLGDLNEI